MAQVLLLKNQFQQFLNKSGDWINFDGGKSFYFSAHRDEIINQKVELAVKAPDLRLEVVEAERDLKGNIELPEGAIDLDKLVRINHQDDTQEDIFTEEVPDVLHKSESVQAQEDVKAPSVDAVEEAHEVTAMPQLEHADEGAAIANEENEEVGDIESLEETNHSMV